MVRFSIIKDPARGESLRNTSLERIRHSQGRAYTAPPLNLNVRNVFAADEQQAQTHLAACKAYSDNVPPDSLARAHGDLELWGKYHALRGLRQVQPFTQAKIDEVISSKYISAVIPVSERTGVAGRPGSLLDNFRRALNDLVADLRRTGIDLEYYGLDPTNWHISVYGITLDQAGVERLSPAEYLQPVKTAANALSGRSLTIDFWGLNVGITPSGMAIGFRGYPREQSLLLGLRDSIEGEIKRSGRRFDEGFRLRLITYLIGLRIFPREAMSPKAVDVIVNFMSRYADTYFGNIAEITSDDIVIRKGSGPAMATLEEISLTS